MNTQGDSWILSLLLSSTGWASLTSPGLFRLQIYPHFQNAIFSERKGISLPLLKTSSTQSYTSHFQSSWMNLELVLCWSGSVNFTGTWQCGTILFWLVQLTAFRCHQSALTAPTLHMFLWKVQLWGSFWPSCSGWLHFSISSFSPTFPMPFLLSSIQSYPLVSFFLSVSCCSFPCFLSFLPSTSFLIPILLSSLLELHWLSVMLILFLTSFVWWRYMCISLFSAFLR